jgi:hypothetical protein
MGLVGALTDQMLTLLLGFALTTVVGGSLGYWFQRRNWEYQNDRTLAEADRAHATDICRELSQLMDRRLYRMWQLKWALSHKHQTSSVSTTRCGTTAQSSTTGTTR